MSSHWWYLEIEPSQVAKTSDGTTWAGASSWGLVGWLVCGGGGGGSAPVFSVSVSVSVSVSDWSSCLSANSWSTGLSNGSMTGCTNFSTSKKSNDCTFSCINWVMIWLSFRNVTWSSMHVAITWWFEYVFDASKGCCVADADPWITIWLSTWIEVAWMEQGLEPIDTRSRISSVVSCRNECWIMGKFLVAAVSLVEAWNCKNSEEFGSVLKKGNTLTPSNTARRQQNDSRTIELH